MLKMSESCSDHSHSVGVTPVYALLIPYGASRMDYGGNTGLPCYFDAVREREESIGSHYRTVEVESEGSGLGDGLSECIHSGGLSDPAGQKHGIFGEYYGVGLGVFDQFIGKKQILHLLCSRGDNGHGLELFRSFDFFVPILDENATQQRTELFGRRPYAVI